MTLWPKPIEYNWRGERLEIAHPGQAVILKPMGPNARNLFCVATIVEINEADETVLLQDRKQQLSITFDDWCWMQASPALEW